MRTLVIGESLIDIVHRPDGSSQEHVGGSPANVAIGLARLGHDVTLATMIGEDERGSRIADLLHDEGVGLTRGSIGQRRTSVATSTLDATGAATYSFDLAWQVGEDQRIPRGPLRRLGRRCLDADQRIARGGGCGLRPQ